MNGHVEIEMSNLMISSEKKQLIDTSENFAKNGNESARVAASELVDEGSEVVE